MSGNKTEGLKPPTPEEITRLREELRCLKSENPNDLDDSTIEEILLLPPTLFFEAVRHLTVTFGPLSTFPVSELPTAATAPHDNPPCRPPNLVGHDGTSFLEDALEALTNYNELLEEKVSKFSIQSARSLATLKESSDSDRDVTAILERVNETKQRNEQHRREIDSIKKSFETHDENRFMKLEDYSPAFWSEVLFLRSHEFIDSSKPAPPAETSLWSEYDYILQHTQRWRDFIDFSSSHEGEATIDNARQLVNALVYTITRHCRMQLETVFQENIGSKVERRDHNRAVHDEAADIVKEIDWLWEEVIPVAHMSVSAQFLRPITKLYKDWESSKQHRMAIVTTYASGVLRFMNDRLSAVAERTKLLVYHQQALYNLASLRMKETSGSGGTVPKRKPHILVNKPRLGPEYSTAAEHIRTFMQLYGAVPIHADDPSPKLTPSLLDEYVQNRTHKGDTLLQDLHKLFEAASKADLADRELGGELVLESLLADSAARPGQPGSVYKDTEMEGSIDVLRDQAKQIQEMFNDLKFEGPAQPADYVAHAYRQSATKANEGRRKGDQNSSVRGPKFEEFLRKWGH
ncbi:hypothetical protein F4678DRAFT_416048 [Xylaria arbuscula]|nr:hypothetical protein F4678DRAFT_416048 [Xylaria arbuscula]